jgi:hypothetical protein
MLKLNSGRLRGLAAVLMLGALSVSAAVAAAPASPDLHTRAEQTAWRETGRYDEVVRLCHAFAQRYPKQVRCDTFGQTPEGRPMLALVVNSRSLLIPAAARRERLPVVLVQAGIHAGEIDGKDGVFQLLRQMLAGELPDLLQDQVLVFVPVFNVDGHERFGAWQRPNQRGPAAMGWRTTSQNLNLNRDYAKADSPEMQAMLRLVQRWDPLATIDLHVTDGAQFEHDIAIMVEPGKAGDAALQPLGRQLRDEVMAQIAAQGALPLPFYPSFVVEDDPSSGFAEGVSTPRFSTGYFQLRNRFGMLVETHSWRPYAHRVKLMHDTVQAVLTQTARYGADWQTKAHDADRRASQLAGQPVVLDWQVTAQSRLIDFRGYAYTRGPSEVSGALMTRYDEHTPQTWRIPLRDTVAPKLTVNAPGAGYLVPAAWAPLVAPRLQVHGVRFETWHRDRPGLSVQTFRAEQAKLAAQSVEGHQRLSVQGQWRDEQRDLGAGALFVPLAQPGARLVMALLEPQAPDAWLAWGMFNNAFEAKEYMEPYVAEDVAREMLARDPALAERFAQRVAQDPGFAKDPQARLDFFYRLHPSFDERLNLYPVLRLNALPTASR